MNIVTYQGDVRRTPKCSPHRGRSSWVARINQEFAKVVNAPDMREKLIAAGAEPAMSSPEEFRAFLARESARLGKLLADAGVKPNP